MIAEEVPLHLRKYIPGADLLMKGKYTYLCHMCGKKEYGDDAYPPACTGPHPSLDEHPMEPMVTLDGKS